MFDAVTMLLSAVVVTVESLLAPPLNGIAWIANMLFSIPIIGLILQVSLRCVHVFAAAIAVSLEVFVCRLRILPEKRLRLRVIILRDENGMPACEPTAVIPHINKAIQLFKRYANIRIIPVRPFMYTSPFKSAPQADEDYVCIEQSTSTKDLLDCRYGRFRPLGRARMSFNAKACRYCFWGNWRRLVGYGAPICAFGVRSIDCGKVGFAGPVLGEYVIVDFDLTVNGYPYASALAHEIGHACVLRHVAEPCNLMNPVLSVGTATVDRLDLEQFIRLRISPHVTYL